MKQENRPIAQNRAADARDPDGAAGKHSIRNVGAFAEKDIWVFDLDNTLYPAGSDLWPKIDARITLFLAHLFGLDGMSSRALQKYYYQRYGTTLRGLMEEHRISAEDYLAFTHDIDRSGLIPNHSLAGRDHRPARPQADPHQWLARSCAAHRQGARPR